MIVPSLLLAFGLALAFAPGVLARRAEAHRLRRLQALKAGGSETYFEEQRDLMADRRSPRFWRVMGVIIAVASAVVLIIRIIRSVPAG